MFIYSNLIYFFFIIYIQLYLKLFYIKYYKIIRAGQLIDLYIYKTKASAGTTIFHVNTIFKKKKKKKNKNIITPKNPSNLTPLSS